MTARAAVHPLAHVDEGALLAEGVFVGPFAVVERGARIGARSRIEAHAVVRTGTTIGVDNVVHPFAVLGGPPQDRRYQGGETELSIGDGNVFREHVTVHRGTEHGGGRTTIGDRGMFMAAVHVAHDCHIGDRVVLANGTLLGGHVVVGDGVATGGLVAVAPFVRIGRAAFLAGGAMVERDVPPFVIAAGDRARVRALNRVGLERAGIDPATVAALKRAFRSLFAAATPRAVAARALARDPDACVRELAESILRDSRSSPASS